ncbi:MAG: hypothetical protein RLY14_1282 [Planctomycetota bacterium]|jgi:hypothetical protein
MKHCMVAMLNFDDPAADRGIEDTKTDDTSWMIESGSENTDTCQTEGPGAPSSSR